MRMSCARCSVPCLRERGQRPSRERNRAPVAQLSDASSHAIRRIVHPTQHVNGRDSVRHGNTGLHVWAVIPIPELGCLVPVGQVGSLARHCDGLPHSGRSLLEQPALDLEPSVSADLIQPRRQGNCARKGRKLRGRVEKTAACQRHRPRDLALLEHGDQVGGRKLRDRLSQERLLKLTNLDQESVGKRDNLMARSGYRGSRAGKPSMSSSYLKTTNMPRRDSRLAKPCQHRVRMSEQIV